MNAIALKQCGVITFEQLRALKLASSTIVWAADYGGLARVCRGLYRLASLRPSWKHLAYASTRLLYPGSALSHFSALHLFALPNCAEPVNGLTLTVPHAMNPVLPKFVTRHRSRIRFGVVKRGDFMVTTIARSLVDVAELVTAPRLEELMDACFLKDRQLAAHLGVELALYGKNGRGGLGMLRKLLRERTGGAESPLETLFHQAKRRFGFELVAQHDILELDGTFVCRADAVDPELKSAIFIDSVEWHFGRVAFDRDAKKRNRAIALGWLVLVFTSTSINDGSWAKDLQDAITLRKRGGPSSARPAPR